MFERVKELFTRRETAQTPTAHFVEAGRNLVGGTIGNISKRIRGAIEEVLSLGKDGFNAVIQGLTINPVTALGRLAVAPFRIGNRLARSAGRAAGGVVDTALDIPKTVYDTGSEVVLGAGEAAIRTGLLVGRVGLTPVAIVGEIKDKVAGALRGVSDTITTGLSPAKKEAAAAA